MWWEGTERSSGCSVEHWRSPCEHIIQPYQKKMSVGGKKTVLGICGCCCGGFGCSILPKECWINGTCVCLCVCVEFCIYKCWRLKCCCVARNYLECSSGPTRINKINGTMLGVDGTAMRRQWLSGGINGCWWISIYRNSGTTTPRRFILWWSDDEDLKRSTY